MPKCELPIKFLTYESGKHGRHKVTNEWICREIREYPNPDSYPLSLADRACVPFSYICDYAKDGEKLLNGLVISDLVIYDEPKELSEFKRFCDGVGGNIGCSGCQYYYSENTESGSYEECCCDNLRPITRPPQSWCYVEEIER